MKNDDRAAESSQKDAVLQLPVNEIAEAEAYNKRAALIFLAAAGATLLLTGATGSVLLRRAQAASTTAPPASTSVRLAASTRPRKASTLKDLFRISASDEGIQAFEFRTNRHLASPSLPTKLPLDFQQAATNETTANVDSQEASNAVADGVKALAIATTIVVGGASVTVYALAKRMGVSDVSAQLAPVHSVGKADHPRLRSHKPSQMDCVTII